MEWLGLSASFLLHLSQWTRNQEFALKSRENTNQFSVVKENCLRVTGWQDYFVKKCCTVFHKKYSSHCAFHLHEHQVLSPLPQKFSC